MVSKRNVIVFWCFLLILCAFGCLGDAKETSYEITSGDMVLSLDSSGRVVGLVIGKAKQSFSLSGGSRLLQCSNVGPVQVVKLRGGGLKFTRTVANENGDSCTVIDSFAPTPNSIRWDVDIYSKEKPWTTSIVTGLRWPADNETKYWTAWSDPDMVGSVKPEDFSSIDLSKADGWRDPLETRSFTDTSRWYGGNPATMLPYSGDYFSLPLCMVIEPDDTIGFSFIQSPDDNLLYMKLNTSSDGSMEFHHTYHRLGDGNRIHFSMDLVHLLIKAPVFF